MLIVIMLGNALKVMFAFFKKVSLLFVLRRKLLANSKKRPALFNTSTVLVGTMSS